jgi:hypothetical protein
LRIKDNPNHFIGVHGWIVPPKERNDFHLNQNKSRRPERGALLLYVGFGLALLALLAWTSIRTLRETPSREVGLDLPGYGWVTLTLTTDPFPPLPGGRVTLDLMVETSRGGGVDVGENLPYRFGMADSPQSLGEGQAVNGPRGYQAQVQFPTPGNYWLVYDLTGGHQARFSLYVKPAQ